MLTAGNVRRSDTKDEGDGAGEDLRGESDTKESAREKRDDTDMVRESQPSCTVSLIVTHNIEWLTKCSYTLMVCKRVDGRSVSR